MANGCQNPVAMVTSMINDEFKILSDESLAVIAWMVLKLLIS